MLPVIALVGRPNVGKSTLFNALTGTRDALVADMPGLTRDRKYGYGRFGSDFPYLVVDTGGLVVDAARHRSLMARADAARHRRSRPRPVPGRCSRRSVAFGSASSRKTLRKLGKHVIVVANKAEGLDASTAVADFISSASASRIAISSAHGDGRATR